MDLNLPPVRVCLAVAHVGNWVEFRSILALVEADRGFIHIAVEPQVLIVLAATFIALPTKLAVYMLEARSLCSIGDPAFS